MAYTQTLNSEERLRIVEALRRGNRSHRELAREFGRAQSTISKIARDAGITATHRRKRTPAASDVESTYDKQERVNFADRVLGVLDGMITEGGLSPRDIREVAQAAKVVLDARRSEDIEPDITKKSEAEEEGYIPVGLGEMRVKADSDIARSFLEIDQKLEEELAQGENSNSDKEYGAEERATLD
jgi:transposase-like protein